MSRSQPGTARRLTATARRKSLPLQVRSHLVPRAAHLVLYGAPGTRRSAPRLIGVLSSPDGCEIVYPPSTTIPFQSRGTAHTV